MMKNILAIGISNSLGQQVLSQLLQNNYQVKVLNSESNNFVSDSLTVLPIDLAVVDSIKREYLSSINQMIFCLENDNNSLQNFGNTGFSFEQLNNLIAKAFYLLNSTETIIFDFSQNQQETTAIWNSVNDVVMGGMSQSDFQIIDKQAFFTGNVSIENNGGFASVRTRNFTSPLDLSDYQGIELRVKGDGKRYKFIARCEGEWDGISYCDSFDTVYNMPITVRVPFNQLRPVVRAKTYNEAEKFDATKIYSLQLMLSKFEYDGELNATFTPGKFSLAIESIKAYGGKEKPQLIVVNSGQESSLEKTIYHSQFSYTLVRYFPIAEIANNSLFSDRNLDLVQLAIKSLPSSTAINQVLLKQN